MLDTEAGGRELCRWSIVQQGTVSSADRLSQGVIAWPQVRRIPMKTSKNREKKKKIPKKSAPAAGHGTPSPPRMDTLWGPRAGPEDCITVTCVGAHGWGSNGQICRTLISIIKATASSCTQSYESIWSNRRYRYAIDVASPPPPGGASRGSPYIAPIPIGDALTWK